MNNTITIANEELQVLSPAVAREYRDVTDDRLLEKVAAGEENAGVFLVFYRYGHVLQQLAAKFAEQGCYDGLLGELVSEVYAHFATHEWRPLLCLKIVNMPGFLYRVERNLVLQMMRRDYRHIGDVVPCDAETIQGQQHRFEDVQQVEQAMNQLSATRQFVLRKRLMEGYESKEVAEMLPDFWRSIGEMHKKAPTNAYVDNMVSAARKEIICAISV